LKKVKAFMSKLFIVGNGFDIEHGLPTKFNPDFKEIAEKMSKIEIFVKYINHVIMIFGQILNILANPDFNNLIEIFDGYYPDYMSDRESDRNGIITQVELNGKLKDSLYEFANQAENKINYVSPLEKYIKIFTDNDIFINFNYTHTIEKLYNIQINKIIHIHGEFGKNNLILGYPEEEYKPEKYVYDVRQGRGPYIRVDFEKYIENEVKEGSMDYYVYTAYIDLIEKTKSFKKTMHVDVFTRNKKLSTNNQ
jgi:hypothetical protein